MEFCLVYARSPLIADTLDLPPLHNYPVPFLVDFKHRCSPDILFYLSFTLCKIKRLTLNIVLEKFSQQDFADYFKLVSNAQVMAMITERAVPHDEARRDYDQLLKDNAESAELGHFRISGFQMRRMATSSDWVNCCRLLTRPGPRSWGICCYRITGAKALPARLPRG